MSDQEELAATIDAHLRTLRNANTQPLAIAWMKTAYLLMERAADDLKRPRVFSLPGMFGEKIYAVNAAKSIALPPFAQRGHTRETLGRPAHGEANWFTGRTTVSDKAWTRTDTLRLQRQTELKRKLGLEA